MQPERIDDLRARLSGPLRDRLVTLVGAVFECEADLFLGLGVLCSIVQQLGVSLPVEDRDFLARYLTIISDGFEERDAAPRRLQ